MKRFTRISLRTLLILITVFAVWLAVQVNRAKRQREAVAWVKANGGEVVYDWQSDEGQLVFNFNEGVHPAPQWLRGLVGDEYFQTVDFVGLSSTQVTDLTPLENLTKLELLALSFTPVTDAQIEQLQEALPNCEIIH